MSWILDAASVRCSLCNNTGETHPKGTWLGLGSRPSPDCMICPECVERAAKSTGAFFRAKDVSNE